MTLYVLFSSKRLDKFEKVFGLPSSLRSVAGVAAKAEFAKKTNWKEQMRNRKGSILASIAELIWNLRLKGHRFYCTLQNFICMKFSSVHSYLHLLLLSSGLMDGIFNRDSKAHNARGD